MKSWETWAREHFGGLDYAPIGAFALRADGTVGFWNRTMERWTGVAADRIVGTDIHMRYPHLAETAYTVRIRAVLDSGVPTIFSARFHPQLIPSTGPDGRPRVQDTTVRPVPTPWGDALCALFLISDVTDEVGLGEPQRARNALPLELAQFSVDRAGDPIFWVDPSGSFAYVNDAACRALGYTRDELLRLTVADIDPHMSPSDWPHHWEQCRQRGNLSIARFHRTKQGNTFPVEISVHHLEFGGREYHCSIARDCTPRRQAEQKLDRAREEAELASRSKSDFLARVSHELRTPMNGILGMTELALETTLDDEQREYLEFVRTCADSLLYLLNDILDLSKIEAGRLELDPIDFCLRHTIDEAMRTFALRAAQKEIELACAVTPDVPDALIGDPGRLRQVIVNLLGNALKFTSEGEVLLRVDLEADGDPNGVVLHFSVADTGIGIPAETQPEIFDAYRQGARTTSRDFGGTGLGLSISRQLVELMGGRIWVESEEGRGSTFHFTAELRPQPVALPVTLPRAELAGRTALVVEDHPLQRRILSALLDEFGLRVQTVENAASALERLRSAHDVGEAVELLIAEAHMPGMDGLELVSTIAEQSDFPEPVTVLLAAVGQRGDGARCRELGVAGYLTKPVARRDLMRALETGLGIRETDTPPQLVTRHTLREEEQRLRILIAEDNPTNQQWLLRTLEKRGHVVSVAHNGRKAVEWAQRERFDVILMDVEMPEMGGVEATELIRAHEAERGRRVPILAFTAHAGRTDEQRCLDAGMDGYLAKPIRTDALFAAIEGAVTERAPTQASTPSQTVGSPGCVFSCEEALERVDGDRDLLVELAEMFISEAPNRLCELGVSLERGDVEELRRGAHTLKGSVGNFSARPAWDAARRLERAAVEEEGMAEAMANLAGEVERLVSALRAWIEK